MPSRLETLAAKKAFAFGPKERLALTDHFLADGIKDQAFVLEFLPNCMANAKVRKKTLGFTRPKL